MTTTTRDSVSTTSDSTHPSTTPEQKLAAATLLLTLDEAARELRCARRSLERHIAGHRLAVVHLGRSVRIERAELTRFISRHREPSAHD